MPTSRHRVDSAAAPTPTAGAAPALAGTQTGWGTACLRAARRRLVGRALIRVNVEDSHAQRDCGFSIHRATGLPPRSSMSPGRLPVSIIAYPQRVQMVKSMPRHHCRSDPVQVQSTSRVRASLFKTFLIASHSVVCLLVIFAPLPPARACLLPD